MAKDPATITLSPTKVDTFVGCRRLFKYRWIDPPFVPQENRYFIIGNLVHKVLEEFHKEYLVSPIKDYKSSIAQHFKKAATTPQIQSQVQSGVINNDDLVSVKGMLVNYLAHIKQEKFPKVRAVEQLKKLTIGGATVWLKADRIDQLADRHYCVVDYKSGRPAAHTDEISSVQIPSYGLLVRHLFDKSAKVSGAYYYLKHFKTRNGIHTHLVTDAWVEECENMYAKVNSALRNGCDFSQNFKYKYCFSCDFRKHCFNDANDSL